MVRPLAAADAHEVKLGHPVSVLGDDMTLLPPPCQRVGKVGEAPPGALCPVNTAVEGLGGEFDFEEPVGVSEGAKRVSERVWDDTLMARVGHSMCTPGE